MEVEAQAEEEVAVAAQAKPEVQHLVLEATSPGAAHARVHVPVLVQDTFLEALQGRVHLTDVVYRRIEWRLVINYEWNIQMQ